MSELTNPIKLKYPKVKFAEFRVLTGIEIISRFKWEFPDIPDSYGDVSNVLLFAARLQTQLRKAGFNYDILTDDGDGKCTIQVGVQVNDVYVELSDWKGWHMIGRSIRELTDIESRSIARFLKKLYT